MSVSANRKRNAPPETREPTVDPGRLIFDPHHHLWPARANFGGYMRDDYLEDASTHAVVGSIFIECMVGYDREAPEPMQPVGETRFIAANCPPPQPGSGECYVAAGIVSRSHFHLDAKDVRRSLEAHVETGEGRFRGVRYSTIWWPQPDVLPGKRRNPPGLMMSDAFRRSFAELAEMRLTFDAFLTYRQLGELADLADAFPEATIVVDHFGAPINPEGTPEGARAAFTEWRASMVELARRPNVHMKMGGVGMPVFGFGYEQMAESPSSDRILADFGPHIEVCLETLGPSRCMFQSNFATDGKGVSFHNLWNAFKKATVGCSEAEKDLLFRGTAARVYDLEAVAYPAAKRALLAATA